jgi:hypothetical protein
VRGKSACLPAARAMLKLLALFERYHNIRGPEEARHDREEGQTHAADIVAIVKARPDVAVFTGQLEAQFAADGELGKRVSVILNDFFRPDIFIYEEYLASTLPAGGATWRRFENRADWRIVLRVLPESSLREK